MQQKTVRIIDAVFSLDHFMYKFTPCSCIVSLRFTVRLFPDDNSIQNVHYVFIVLFTENEIWLWLAMYSIMNSVPTFGGLTTFNLDVLCTEQHSEAVLQINISRPLLV